MIALLGYGKELIEQPFSAMTIVVKLLSPKLMSTPMQPGQGTEKETGDQITWDKVETIVRVRATNEYEYVSLRLC